MDVGPSQVWKPGVEVSAGRRPQSLRAVCSGLCPRLGGAGRDLGVTWPFSAFMTPWCSPVHMVLL